MIGNVIWPFQKFGLCGCVVMFVYWPIALPLIGIICAFYYLPTIFLTVRMFYYSKRAFLRYTARLHRAAFTAVCLFVCVRIFIILGIGRLLRTEELVKF